MRIVAFGAPNGTWGIVWEKVALLSHGATPASIENEGAESAWRLSGAGVTLTIEPLDDPARSEGALPGFDQRCRVRGEVDEASLDCLGRRSERELEHADFGSIRDVCGLFDPDLALTLTALRGRSAEGHEQDIIAASVLDPSSPIVVADPRLSTTYGTDGGVTRVGLELWLGQEEHEYPLRAAGEVAGASVSAESGGVALEASPLRWHARGLDGTGVYLLARPVTNI